jgi:hypothetical protein
MNNTLYNILLDRITRNEAARDAQLALLQTNLTDSAAKIASLTALVSNLTAVLHSVDSRCLSSPAALAAVAGAGPTVQHMFSLLGEGAGGTAQGQAQGTSAQYCRVAVFPVALLAAPVLASGVQQSANSLAVSWLQQIETDDSHPAPFAFILQMKPAFAPDGAYTTVYKGWLYATTVTGLLPYTRYTFRAAAINAAGVSAWSPEATLKTQPGKQSCV